MLVADFWQDKNNSQRVIKEKKLYEDLTNSLNNTVSLLSFSYEQHKKRENNNPAIFINETLSEIVLINDKVIAELKLTELSTVTGISIDSINDNYSKLIDKKNYKPKIENKPPKDKSNLKNIEYDLIKLCFSKNRHIRTLISEKFKPEWLKNKMNVNIFNAVYIHLSSEEPIDGDFIVTNLEQKDEKKYLIDLLFEIDDSTLSIKMAEECISRLKQKFIKEKIENLRDSLKINTNDTNVKSIISEIDILQKEMNENI